MSHDPEVGVVERRGPPSLFPTEFVHPIRAYPLSTPPPVDSQRRRKRRRRRRRRRKTDASSEEEAQLAPWDVILVSYWIGESSTFPTNLLFLREEPTNSRGYLATISSQRERTAPEPECASAPSSSEVSRQVIGFGREPFGVR